MRLYFLRHATAEDRQAGRPDADRRLTDEGIEETRGVARGICALGLEFDAILTSPLARARETAEIVADGLKAGKVLQEEPRLASGAGFGDLQDALQGLKADAHVLVVGHEPDLSGFVGRLIGGGRVRMKKAALACIDAADVEPGAGELRWLISPGQFEKLAE